MEKEKMIIEPEKVTEADAILTKDDIRLIKEIYTEYCEVTDELESLSFDDIAQKCGISKETARKQYSCPTSETCSSKAQALFDRKRELQAARSKCDPLFIAEKFYISVYSARRLYTQLSKEGDIMPKKKNMGGLTQKDMAEIKPLAEKYYRLKDEFKKYSVDGMAEAVGKKKHQFVHVAYGQRKAPWQDKVKNIMQERTKIKSELELCSPKFVSEKYNVSKHFAEKAMRECIK